MPEFKHVSFASLIAQLSALGYPVESGAATKAVREIEVGGEPPNMDHTYDTKALQSQTEVIRRYRTQIKPKTGFWALVF
jgi:hypothetical protein